jgi:hypothetical protein
VSRAGLDELVAACLVVPVRERPTPTELLASHPYLAGAAEAGRSTTAPAFATLVEQYFDWRTGQAAGVAHDAVEVGAAAAAAPLLFRHGVPVVEGLGEASVDAPVALPFVVAAGAGDAEAAGGAEAAKDSDTAGLSSAEGCAEDTDGPAGHWVVRAPLRPDPDVIEGQLEQIGRFRLLLQAMPASRAEIAAQAHAAAVGLARRVTPQLDGGADTPGAPQPGAEGQPSPQLIPPLLRAELWPVLLGIDVATPPVEPPDSLGIGGLRELRTSPGEAAADQQASAPSEAVASAVKQLEIDGRRCHQYDMVMASAAGQRCLKLAVLRWLEADPRRRYWQGLDSLAAPFVLLAAGFHGLQEPCGLAGDLATADPGVDYCAASLDALTDWFLPQMFSEVGGGASQAGAQNLLQELAVLTRLLGHVHPGIARHLLREGVSAELFAIPWLLTLFSHSLPLRDTAPLWDRLLSCDGPGSRPPPPDGGAPTGGPGLVLFLCIAVLEQLWLV